MSIVCSQYEGAFLSDDGLIVRGEISFEILDYDDLKQQLVIRSVGTTEGEFQIKLSQLFDSDQIEEVIKLILEKVPEAII